METTFATRDQAGAYRDRTLTAVFEREDEAEATHTVVPAADAEGAMPESPASAEDFVETEETEVSEAPENTDEA